MIQDEVEVSNDAKSVGIKVKLSFSDWPGRSSRVFAKDLNSLAGLSNLPDGALTFN